MFSDDLLIRADRNPQPVTLKEFLTAPEKTLQSADERLWFGSKTTFERIPESTESLESEPGIVQFHSDPVWQDLSEAASPSVNAALGFSGLTSIPRSIVEAGLASHEYDLSCDERTLSVQFLLSVADRCQSCQSLSRADTSFRYFSPIPSQQADADRTLLDTIQSMDDNELTRGNSAGPSAVEIRAGLLLIHDFLEPSHACSQSIQGEGPDANGDYWHAIMHRREPDFGNSKYWFRRVGEHPCFVRLADAARQLSEHFPDPRATEAIEKLTQNGWDAMAAVDFFQEAHLPQHQGTPFHQFASCLQMQEMLILLGYCCLTCEGS